MLHINVLFKKQVIVSTSLRVHTEHLCRGESVSLASLLMWSPKYRFFMFRFVCARHANFFSHLELVSPISIKRLSSVGILLFYSH